MDNTNVNSTIKEKNLYYTTNVWDAILLDETGGVTATAVALSESSVALATEMIKKKGGSSNLTLFSIPSNKDLTVALTALDFNDKWLALQTGEKFNLGKFVVQGISASCEVTATADKKEITLPEIPYGNFINIVTGENTIKVPITDPASSTIDVTAFIGAENTCLNIIYAAELESEQLEIAGDTPPAVVNLVLKKKVWSGKTNQHVRNITLNIERFQFDGNFTFAGALGDTDTFNLGGSALAASSKSCGSTNQTLGTINIQNVDGTSVYDASRIVATPSIEIAVGEFDTITVVGEKGSSTVYAPFDVTAKCTYTSADETKVTVDTTGKVTGVAATVDTPVKITVAFNGLTVETDVAVTAAP